MKIAMGKYLYPITKVVGYGNKTISFQINYSIVFQPNILQKTNKIMDQRNPPMVPIHSIFIANLHFCTIGEVSANSIVFGSYSPLFVISYIKKIVPDQN